MIKIIIFFQKKIHQKRLQKFDFGELIFCLN